MKTPVMSSLSGEPDVPWPIEVAWREVGREQFVPQIGNGFLKLKKIIKVLRDRPLVTD